jgi:hypothetical protein
MALTEAFHLGPYGALLVCALAASASVVTVLRIVERAGLVDHQREWFMSVVIAALAIAATSAIALPMTGMEHSLHVWASIATFGGLVEAAHGRTPSLVHFAAVVLLVLVRFEGAAFAIAAIIAFAVLGQRRFAALAALVICCLLAVYLASMSLRGLPLLPSSVLLKSHVAEAAYGEANPLGALVHNLSGSLNPYGIRLGLLGLAVALGMWLLRSDRSVLIVCLAVLAAVGAHLAAGQYDWFHRYEVYIISLASTALLYVTARLKSVLRPFAWTGARFGAILLVAYASTPYVLAAVETPLASRGIFEQQYQMSLLAQRIYNRPVAVNDLGLVAYGNSNFVLDLWGLGSEKVRKARLANRYGPNEMAALAEEHHIGLAMIYDQWFPKGVPASWTRVAVLRTRAIAAAESNVTFYRTPAADAESITRALRLFQSVLPPRDSLEIVAQ